MGNSLLLLAHALGASGGSVAGVPINWRSSDVSVASITADGVLRGAAAGSARIFASVGDVTQGFRVDVQEPAPGTLVVTPRPWAFVLVNGVRQGEDQTRLVLSLKPGTYILRLERPNWNTFDTTVVIQSGDTTTVFRVMTQGGGP